LRRTTAALLHMVRDLALFSHSMQAQMASSLVAAALVCLLAAGSVPGTNGAQKASAQVLSEAKIELEFVAFVRKFDRSYAPSEFFSRYIRDRARCALTALCRFKAFKQRLSFVRQHNAEAAKGLHAWTAGTYAIFCCALRPYRRALGVNQFADMTSAEFRAAFLSSEIEEPASAGTAVWNPTLAVVGTLGVLFRP
jgi:hypothetical protein